MPRRASELSAKAVEHLSEGLHAVGGVSGLYLQVKGSARSWCLRFTSGGRRREAGLGSFHDVSLKQAREIAREHRAQIAQGIDPIEKRKQLAVLAVAFSRMSATFDTCAASFIASKEAEWSNVKHGDQWRNTIAAYASPVIGSQQIADVDTPAVLQVLEPHWRSKTETMVRLRGRLESVLDWATVRGYRSGPNPARWKGHLQVMLPAPSRVAKTTHHAAISYQDMPEFMNRLKSIEGVSARALEFAILTASRSGEVRGMTWGEVDLINKMWTIPGPRMKAKRPHRVPLSTRAVEILDSRSEKRERLVFASTRSDGQLSDMALTAVCRRLKVEAVPHGLARATFKTWAAEKTSFPRDVIEQALAHTLTNKTEDAYWRGDLFEKRQRLMDEWCTFLVGRIPEP